MVGPGSVKVKLLVCPTGLSQAGAVPSTMNTMSRKPAPQHVGLSIRRRRIEAGLTQAELAHKIDSADATLSRIERGKFSPSQNMLETIASALGCGVRDFYEQTKPAPRSVRPSQAKLIALTSDMTDAEVDDVVRAIRVLVRVGRRTAARP